MFDLETERQLDLLTQDLLRALIAAFLFEHGGGVKIIAQSISPTDFDDERRWWLESDEGNIQFDQQDVQEYYKLTNIPPDKAMLSFTVDGNKVDLCFMPRQLPETN